MSEAGEQSLALLTNANRMLVECKSVEDAKSLADVAEAARVYARRAKLGEEAIRHATEIKLRAERKAGEILAVAPKNEGGNPSLPTSSTKEPVAPTLSDLGVTKKESSRYQKLAAIPADKFEQVAKGDVPVSAALRPDPLEGVTISSPTGEDMPKEGQGGKLPPYVPSNGLEYATMAIAQLQKIQPQDTQRQEAFAKVRGWIDKQN